MQSREHRHETSRRPQRFENRAAVVEFNDCEKFVRAKLAPAGKFCRFGRVILYPARPYNGCDPAT
jgi:hypothetical protein